PGLPFFDLFLNRIITKGNLGNQHSICGGCNAGIECNPAGITAHHLYPHQTMMRLSRGSDTVNGFSSDTDRCIKAQCYITAINIVVDGFRHAHYVDALFNLPTGDVHRAVTPDGNERIDIIVLEGFHQPAGDITGFPASVIFLIGHLEGIAWIGRTQDGSALQRNAADGLGIQLNKWIIGINGSVSVFNTKYFPSALQGSQCSRPDSRIKPRRITPAGIDSYSHNNLSSFL